MKLSGLAVDPAGGNKPESIQDRKILFRYNQSRLEGGSNLNAENAAPQ